MNIHFPSYCFSGWNKLSNFRVNSSNTHYFFILSFKWNHDFINKRTAPCPKAPQSCTESVENDKYKPLIAFLPPMKKNVKPFIWEESLKYVLTIRTKTNFSENHKWHWPVIKKTQEFHIIPHHYKLPGKKMLITYCVQNFYLTNSVPD